MKSPILCLVAFLCQPLVAQPLIHTSHRDRDLLNARDTPPKPSGQPALLPNSEPPPRDVYVLATVRLNEGAPNPEMANATVHRLHSAVFIDGNKLDGPLQVDLLTSTDSRRFALHAYDFGSMASGRNFHNRKTKDQKRYRAKIGQTRLTNAQLAHRRYGTGLVTNVGAAFPIYSTYPDTLNTDNTFIKHFVQRLGLTLPDMMAKLFRDDDVYQSNFVPNWRVRVKLLVCETPIRGSRYLGKPGMQVIFNITDRLSPAVILDMQFYKAWYNYGRSYPNANNSTTSSSNSTRPTNSIAPSARPETGERAASPVADDSVSPPFSGEQNFRETPFANSLHTPASPMGGQRTPGNASDDGWETPPSSSGGETEDPFANNGWQTPDSSTGQPTPPHSPAANGVSQGPPFSPFEIESLKPPV